MSKGVGYGQKRLVENIIKTTWKIDEPSQKKLSLNDVLYILQELQDEEGIKYQETNEEEKRVYVYKEFVKYLLHRNLANYDSMLLMTSEKGCLTGETIITYKHPQTNLIKKNTLKELAGQGPIEVLSYNDKEKNFEYQISQGVELVKTDDVYELETLNGLKIKGTKDHPFLTNKLKYEQLKDLKQKKVLTTQGLQQVKTVKKLKNKQEVFDVVNVNQNKNFVANDYVVSNSGKSSAAIILAREWCRLIGIKFDPNRHLAYSNKDVMDKIDMLNKFEPLVCVTADTKIRVRINGEEKEERIDRLVNISKYEVLTYNVDKDFYEYKTPEKTIKQSEKKAAYTIILEDGNKLKITGNHLVLTKKGYKKVKDLTTKDEIKILEQYCLCCGKNFKRLRSFQKYCSKKCQRYSKRDKNINYLKKYRQKNKDLLKQKRDDNRKHINNVKRLYSLKNKKYRLWKKKYQKEYHIKNKEKIKNSHKKWIKNNYEKYREYYKNWHKKKMSTDPEYKIKRNLRRRIGLALNNKGIIKDKSLNTYIGCTITKFKKHIEKQFTEGMSWKNYGNGGWVIDHIKPCSSFNLVDEKEKKACFNYKNLQPLWEKDNLYKGDKL